MKNRWNYDGLGRVTYGSTETYKRAAEWLDGHGSVIEDWGCGCAAFKEYVNKSKYIGIEGSKNAYADKCDVNLIEYTSSCDCILLRHVICHNVQWEKILKNAIQSFKKRMVLITFMPMASKTEIAFVNTDKRYAGVPDFRFRAGDLVKHFVDYLVKVGSVGNETLFYLEK